MAKTTMTKADMESRRTQISNYFTADAGAQSLFRKMTSAERVNFQTIVDNMAVYAPDVFTGNYHPAAIYKCVAKAHMFGLLPNGHDGAIAVFKGTPTFVIMTAGARRKMGEHPLVNYFDVQVVYANDKVTLNYFMNKPPVLDVGDPFNRGKIVGVVGCVGMNGGGYLIDCFSQDWAIKNFLPSWAGSDHYSKRHPEAFLKNCMTKHLYRKLPPANLTQSPELSNLWADGEIPENNAANNADGNASEGMPVVVAKETPPEDKPPSEAAPADEGQPI